MSSMGSKKVFYYQLIKSFFIISSFLLLLFILNQVVTSRDEYFGRERTYTIELVIISLIISFIFLISIFEVLTLKEYKGYITRKPHFEKANAYLTLPDIFDNENRLNILREILNNPGIHQNELLRKCDLHKGQLQWHLDVLLKNQIIKKEMYGQYSLYFPITSSIEVINAFKRSIAKSKTTNKIFELIQKNPGISSSEISQKINLARNTVKYHIDKLSGKNLIHMKKNGRKIELYSKI